MVAHMMGAVLRGVLVSLLVATPSLLLPGNFSHAPEMIALLAILAGVVNGLVLVLGPDVPPGWRFAQISVQVLEKT